MASSKIYTIKTCAACGTSYEHWHYASKFCSTKCYTKVTYENTRVQQLDKNFQLQKVYGISLQEYNALLEQQHGVCAICEKPETQTHKKTKAIMNLSVDHDHTTGHVRGLLCKKCNMALGLFQDSRDLLQNADKYLLERGIK